MKIVHKTIKKSINLGQLCIKEEIFAITISEKFLICALYILILR